jgi:lipid-binding SYLF domain-containing protein
VVNNQVLLLEFVKNRWSEMNYDKFYKSNLGQQAFGSELKLFITIMEKRRSLKQTKSMSKFILLRVSFGALCISGF